MKILNSLLVLFIFFSGNIVANAPTTLPTNLKLVGTANLSIWWWDIYDAELYNAEGIYKSNQGPLLLKLTYQREIDSEDLVSETASQWERFSLGEDKTQAWLEQVATIWPDVKENDSITFYIDKIGNCHFYFNGQFIGSIKDPEFSENFVNIWLANDGPYPTMTRKLTGTNTTEN